jgi:hypothetical protein
MSQRKREAKEWEREHRATARDPDVFSREILPGLQGIPLRRLAERTGLSLPYCSQIRRGLKVPHPRHWDLFRSAASPAKPPRRVEPVGTSSEEE